MLTRQNGVISDLSKQAQQLQLDQKQTVITADEVISQLKMAVDDIRDMQTHTGRKVSMADSQVGEQHAQIEQLADVAKSQHGVNTSTLNNQNALAEELRMHREAIQILEQRQETSSSPIYGADNRQRRHSAPVYRPAAEVVSRETRTTTVEETPPFDEMQMQYDRNVKDRQATIVYSQVTAPPVFNIDRFEEWKKSMAWWLELNDGITQPRLLAALGVNSGGLLKSMLQDYFDSTKDNRDTRCAQAFINKINERFKRPAEEIAMQRIDQRNDIKRRSNEGFKEFWCRFERLSNKLVALGIQWPEKVLFQKAFAAAGMTEDQKSLVRATLELNPGNETVLELRRLTCKMFDHAIQVFDDVYNAQDKNGEMAEHWDDNVEDTAEIREARKTNPKNRGGNVDKAIKNAHTAFGLNPGGQGGKGKPSYGHGGCRNCQSPSHWWGDCPNLLQKKTVFGKAVGKHGKSAKPSKGKGAERTSTQ